MTATTANVTVSRMNKPKKAWMKVLMKQILQMSESFNGTTQTATILELSA